MPPLYDLLNFVRTQQVRTTHARFFDFVASDGLDIVIGARFAGAQIVSACVVGVERFRIVARGFVLFGLTGAVRVEVRVRFVSVPTEFIVLGGFARFRFDQGFAVSNRNLIVVGMNFVERQETVSVAAVVDERRLKRRFDSGDFGEVDVPLELGLRGRLEVKFLGTVSLDDHDPGFFRVGRVDEHFCCHVAGLQGADAGR